MLGYSGMEEGVEDSRSPRQPKRECCTNHARDQSQAKNACIRRNDKLVPVRSHLTHSGPGSSLEFEVLPRALRRQAWPQWKSIHQWGPATVSLDSRLSMHFRVSWQAQ